MGNNVRGYEPNLTITSDPPGATVYGGNVAKGITPLVMFVTPGVTTIWQLKKDGYYPSATFSLYYNLSIDQMYTKHIILAPVPATPKYAVGDVIASNYGYSKYSAWLKISRIFTGNNTVVNPANGAILANYYETRPVAGHNQGYDLNDLIYLPISGVDNPSSQYVLVSSLLGKLRVIVRDEYDTLVFEATVNLGGIIGNTGTSGVCEFNDITPNNNYNLIINKEGYEEEHMAVYIGEGITTVTVTMYKTVVTPTEGAITGIVTDGTNGGPLAGAIVYLGGEGGTPSPPTGADGKFGFTNVPFGDWDLWFTKTGYDTVKK
jgi:hypothetical protein